MVRERNPFDDDYDRRPGNASQSRSYARRYDPRSEQEFSNLPEIANQTEISRTLSNIRAQRQQAREALLDAQSHVHFFPSVGKFVIPKENTWAAHAEMIRDKDQSLYFNPEKYAYFDQIIAEKFPAVMRPEYEGLRNNLAVMRNDIIGLYLDDGSFDPGDERFVPQIAGVAAALGDALAGDSWYRRAFVRSVDTAVANVEGVGAREMYNYLLRIQTRPNRILSGIRAALNMPDYSFGLPPLARTPYSEHGLSAPPPRHDLAFTPAELVAACASPEMQTHLQQTGALQKPMGERLAHAGEISTALAENLHRPEELAPPTRDASIEEARTILRWLRNLTFTDKNAEEWIGHGEPPEQVAKAEGVARLVEIYAAQLHQAAARQAPIGDDFVVHEASNAAGVLALALGEHGLSQLPPGHAQARKILAQMDGIPETADTRYGDSVERLLDTVEVGLERVSGRSVHDRPAADRILDSSHRLSANAWRLSAIDHMEPPAREESIELAREILRKLKSLSFSDQTLKELVDTGSPEDKAAFAQQLQQMADIYSNLLAEAAQANPGLANDPQVRAASDAVGGFNHAVKLMAAKEMPGSVAAAQQISADITQMPEEWKKLHNHTVDRLVASMEGGLEKAVGSIDVQQQEMEQDQEEMQQAAAEAALSHDQLRRRKKRKRCCRSGGGGAKQRRQHMELTADDFVLKQGRFREHGGSVPNPVQQHFTPNLRAEDMDTVRKLGGNLRDINQQAQGIPVPAADPLAPDDKTFALRERDPKNPNQRPRDRI